ncbi:MAG TPA: jacalin-like lectin [Aquabacterium sp.]|nr:jacalin-like lectin [Aquabacterium sp.]
MRSNTSSRLYSFRRVLIQGALTLFGLQAWSIHAHAQGMPEVSPSLKKMLGALPLADLKGQVQGMVGALKQTSCGGGLTGCYATESGPLQLYFFTSKQAQQTFLLVIDKKMALPALLKDNVQKALGGTQLKAPIISISTTDVALDTVKMPPSLQRVVREDYFNVSSLSFASGVQLAARADLGGGIKLAMESLGVKADQLTMRAAVVMPIPTDLASGAGTGAGLADAMAHDATMKKAATDAVKPEAYVEFQFAPNARISLTSPQMNLTDMTFFLNNALTFGYKGNATFKGVGDKKFLVQFQTPLDPAGAMDLLDFQFRMATPAHFTMEDAANVMVAMATPDPRLAKYGGGYIRNIESYKRALLSVAQPLSAFQLKNPQPAPEYRFGDSTKPWPDDPKYYNIALLGPTATDGPLMRLSGQATFLGQRMGYLDATASRSGLHGQAIQDLSFKLGPLGKVTIQKMVAAADVDKDKQYIRLKGNLAGQSVEVVLNGNTMALDVPATCENPFEIKTKLAFDANTDIAKVFDGQAGANVDPSKIGGCVGQQLQAALNKVAGEYKNLSGYSADEANQALIKLTGSASQEYERAKDAARDAASKSSSAANRAFNDAGNAFKRLGKKKKHKKGPDPKFAASVFDWDYYYDHAPDVVKAGVDLATHWRDNGFQEGRQGSLEFNARYYWQRYPDIQQLCPNQDLQCALQHWLDHGISEGRQGSPDFSVSDYLNRYGDLQNAFGRYNYEDALDHWLNNGEDEGRNGAPASPYSGPVSGPLTIGGGGGGAWDDYGACNGQYVRGFRVNSSNKSVDGLQFLYPGSGWSRGQGSTKFKQEVVLGDDEYIVQVNYQAGSRVDGLSFITNRGRTFGPYGNGGSNGSYAVTPGQKLGCMAGRAGKSIDQLTFSSTGPR